MTNKERCIGEVEKRREKIVSLSQYIHKNPEVALEEHLASEKITSVLKNEGFIIQEKLEEMPTAVVGFKKNGEGPRIAFIAEYDALPGLGHACGHNIIAAMSVGAALALSSMLDLFKGEIWLIGTPGEEIGAGKPFMIEKGIFDKVDVAMMIHPSNKTSIAPTMLALAGLEFIFHGKPSHASAAPHEGINALDAVIQLFNNVNALREQMKDDARVHGIILEGGDAPNIIPHKTRARLEVRARENEYLLLLIERVKKCGEAAALATGTRAEIDFFEPTCDALESNKTLCEIFKEALDYFCIVEFNGDASCGSSDMGNVSVVVPSIHPSLDITNNKKIELHTKEFEELTGSVESHESTILGSKLLALTGLAILEKPELLTEIQNDFKNKELKQSIIP